jgi:hypothetical protein
VGPSTRISTPMSLSTWLMRRHNLLATSEWVLPVSAQKPGKSRIPPRYRMQRALENGEGPLQC